MAELKNTFSWSFSAASDFEECPRRRYWSKYAMWGGWGRNAPDLSRAAYRLNKMDNFYSIMGHAAEESVMWAFYQKKKGREVSVEEAYEQVAKPLLNRCWKESLGGQWRDQPKQFCCLREHYFKNLYGAEVPDPGPRVLNADEIKAWTEKIIEQTKQCITHFLATVYPRISEVSEADIVPVATMDKGDPESFQFNGIKIYAIPDFVYRKGETMHIHDWKAGRPRPSHHQQVMLYGLWAVEKHGMRPAAIQLHLEYLAQDEHVEVDFTDESLEAVKASIDHSVGDMTMYLVNQDRNRNEAVDREEWDLAVDPGACRNCNFFELCEPELKELFGA